MTGSMSPVHACVYIILCTCIVKLICIHTHVDSIDLVGDTAQLAKIADGSIKKLKLRSRTSSPVNS